MALTGSPLVLQAGSHSAVKFRQFVASLTGSQSGVDGPNSCLVKQRVTPGQGMLVSAGGIWLVGSSLAPTQGSYYDYNDADADVAAPAADATNSRIDRLVYRVFDPDYVGGSDTVGDFEWVQGVAAGSPVVPAVPSDSISLAQVLRTATNNTIMTTDSTDERTFVTNFGNTPRLFSSQNPTSGNSLTFTPPAGFTALQFKGQVRSGKVAVAETLVAQFNGDTSANYYAQQTYGNNNAMTSTQQIFLTTNAFVARCPGSTGLASAASSFDFIIQNYGGTTFFKKGIAQAEDWEGTGAANQFVNFSCMMWQNTAAITSVTLFLGTGPFVAGSYINGYVWP